MTTPVFPNEDIIKEICASLKKQIDDPNVLFGIGRSFENFDSLPTGIKELDSMLHGGIATGRITEIYGSEGSGKTTCMLHAIAACQQRGEMVYFVDAENALDLNYAQRIGVQPQRMIYSQPEYGEQALELTRLICEEIAKHQEKSKTRLRSLIVVDSVAALVPKQDFEATQEDGIGGSNSFARRAAMLSTQLPRLLRILSKSGAALVFINQERDNIGGYGAATTQPGGRALKFFSSVRIKVKKKGQYPPSGTPVGIVSEITPVKSKLFPIFGKSLQVIIGENGIDQVVSLVDKAIEAGVIEKGGGWYKAPGDVKAQGQLGMVDTVRKDKKLMTLIEEQMAKLPNKKDE